MFVDFWILWSRNVDCVKNPVLWGERGVFVAIWDNRRCENRTLAKDVAILYYNLELDIEIFQICK